VPFDADNDGDLDILITNNAQPPSFFVNELPPSVWLRVRLEGQTNRYGVGAEVWVTLIPGATPMRRDVLLNNTYLAHGPIEAHFGLGEHVGSIHEVRVVWPDTRAETVLSDVVSSHLS